MNDNYTIFKKQPIMEISVSNNETKITKKAIEASLESFYNKPIVYNINNNYDFKSDGSIKFS
jgi:hypothetical protein